MTGDIIRREEINKAHTHAHTKYHATVEGEIEVMLPQDKG